MKDRLWSTIVLVVAFAAIIAWFVVGCIALKRDPSLWLFAAVGVQSPRGAEAFAGPTISAKIEWDDFNTDPKTFRVYLRQQGRTYAAFSDAGTNRVFQFTGLQRKTTYKCVVTTIKNGVESHRSDELTFRTGNKSNDVEEL